MINVVKIKSESLQRKSTEIKVLKTLTKKFKSKKVQAASKIIQKLTKASIDQLGVPFDITIHPCGQYLYELFLKLCHTRAYSELGPLPITVESIYYYFKLINYEPINDIKWEVDTLLTLDKAWLTEHYNSKDRKINK